MICLQECQHLKQQVLSLRRENGSLDTEVHEKERSLSQLQMRVAVLEQEIKDKDQLMLRTKEVLEATQQQKVGESSCFVSLWKIHYHTSLLLCTAGLLFASLNLFVTKVDFNQMK